MSIASSQPNSEQPTKPTRIRTAGIHLALNVLAVEGENVGPLAFMFDLLPLGSSLRLGGNRELLTVQASVIACASRDNSAS